MVIFRENTEDIYAGIEFESGTEENKKIKRLLKDNFRLRYEKIRFPDSSGIGLKPISKEGTNRLVRSSIEYAIRNKKESVTFVHKGNIMKYTEGSFRDWAYQLVQKEYGSVDLDGGPWQVINFDNL